MSSATFPQCRFLEAKSGEEAVAMASAQPPDIVLMDIGLPQMNGIEATRRIKAVVPQAQVVMLSIYDDPAHQADAVSAGACAYIPKRKMHTELIPVVAALLSHSSDTGLVPCRESALSR